MKNESKDNEICDKICELTAKICERIEEVKALACNNIFDNQKIIGICQQINIMLNQIEILQEFINEDNLGPDPLK